jgi:L-rhamnose mutarotase
MHRDVWPDMLAAMTAAGVRSQDIYRRDDLLVGIIEVDDLSAMLEQLRSSDVAARWQREIAKLAFNERDPATGYLPQLEKVFSLEEALASAAGGDGHVAGP